MRNSDTTMRSSLPCSMGGSHWNSLGCTGDSPPRTAFSVPRRWRRKYSCPLTLEPSGLVRQKHMMRGTLSSCEGASTAMRRSPDFRRATACLMISSSLVAPSASALRQISREFSWNCG